MEYSAEVMIRRSLYALTALLIGVSAAGASDAYHTYRSLQEDSFDLLVPEPEPEILPSPKKKVKKDYNIITRRNLFALASLHTVKPKPSLPTRPNLKALSRSQAFQQLLLNIRLVGTTVGPEGVRYAIFEDTGSRKHRIYRLGERIQGAIIQRIDRSEVHLQFGGKTKILRAFDPAQSEWSRNPRHPPPRHLRSSESD